jgi:hypothetical protein
MISGTLPREHLRKKSFPALLLCSVQAVKIRITHTFLKLHKATRHIRVLNFTHYSKFLIA